MGSDRYMESRFQAQDNFWPTLMHLERAVRILEKKELSQEEREQLIHMRDWIKRQERT